MKHIVCITEKEYGKAKHIFESANNFKFVPVSFEEDILASTVKNENAYAVVIGIEPYKAELYKTLARGSCIARFGIGHDGVDKVQASMANIFVTNTPGVLDDSVAEHAIWLMGTLARQIVQHDSSIRQLNWLPSLGIELAGKTLLIVGCGKIGSKVAKIASLGFGMTVIGYDAMPVDPQKLNGSGFTEIYSSLDCALRAADFISLHIPSLPQTRHFINSDLLAKIRPGSFLINTARGPIIDENALFDFLNDGHIAGAGLDVFENEPYAPMHPEKDLRKLPNVVLTPHVGSSTAVACVRMAQRVIANLDACIEKRYSDMDIVNSEILKVFTK